MKEGNVTHARRLVSGMIKARNYDERIREESNRGGDSETSEVDFIQWAYNCALGAAGKGADWEAAFEILEEMRANGKIGRGHILHFYTHQGDDPVRESINRWRFSWEQMAPSKPWAPNVRNGDVLHTISIGMLRLFQRSYIPGFLGRNE